MKNYIPNKIADVIILTMLEKDILDFYDEAFQLPVLSRHREMIEITIFVSRKQFTMQRVMMFFFPIIIHHNLTTLTHWPLGDFNLILGK